MKQPNSIFIQVQPTWFLPIVPVDWDPNKPNGTGPFSITSFSPQQTIFERYENYWNQPLPYVDKVVLSEYADITAQVNALLGGQVDTISLITSNEIASLESQGKKLVISPGGGMNPFTMNTQVAPFDDVRVRQAMRLIIDRPQMLDLVFKGNGTLGNDVFSRWDPAYDTTIPQREQDIEQAKSLLKQAGQEGLTVELVTADIAMGVVSSAQVFAEQAKAAGVTVNVRKTTVTDFFGPEYLKYPFAFDYWGFQYYLPQVQSELLPTSPYWETHWDDPRTQKLYKEALATPDEAKRAEICHEMQLIDHEEGGLMIPFFPPVIDASVAQHQRHPAEQGGRRLEQLRLQELLAELTRRRWNDGEDEHQRPRGGRARDPGAAQEGAPIRCAHRAPPRPRRGHAVPRLHGDLRGHEVLPGNAAYAVLGQHATPERVAALESSWTSTRAGRRAVLGLDLRACCRATWASRSPTAIPWPARRCRASPTRPCSCSWPALFGTLIGVAAGHPGGGAPRRLARQHPVGGRAGRHGAARVRRGHRADDAVRVARVALASRRCRSSRRAHRPGPSPSLLVLPVATLVIVIVPYIFRMMRARHDRGAGERLRGDGKLKGVRRRRVMLVHALPNSIAPTIQVIGLNLLYLAGGIVVVEYVFAYPGHRRGARRRRLGARHPGDPVHRAGARRVLRLHEHRDRRDRAARHSAAKAATP